MAGGNLFNRYGKELEAFLQLRTSPIALKMLEKENDIPKAAIRPKRDLRAHLALCQGLALSRRDGATVAMLKEDNWCSIPVVAFGLAAPPDFYLQGRTEYKVRIGSRKAAKDWAKNSPRLKVGKYIGVLSAPLRTAKFEPDLVVIYCNSAQLKCLLDGMKYKNGTLVTSTLEPAGACVQSNVRPLLSGECQVAVPCGGDRKWALAKDDELIFSVPKDKMKDLMFGLRHFYKAGDGYPHMTAGMKFEYPLYRKNLKVGKMIGMDLPG